MTRSKRQKRNDISALPKGDIQTKRKNKYTTALMTTLFAVGGIYITFFVLLLSKGADVAYDIYEAQALLGGLYVNLFAVIGVAYSKFADEMFLHKNVFWLTLVSFVILICIYAQACAMNDFTIPLIAEWMRAQWVSLLLQISLIVLIFILAIQTEMSARISYNKIKLY